jgi:hypothetical protein
MKWCTEIAGFLTRCGMRQTVDVASLRALTSAGSRPYVCVEMNYFAYGSNLNTGHLRSWLIRWGVARRNSDRHARSILPGYRLRTNYLRSIGSRGVQHRAQPTEQGRGDRHDRYPFRP